MAERWTMLAGQQNECTSAMRTQERMRVGNAHAKTCIDMHCAIMMRPQWPPLVPWAYRHTF
eukprot:8523841-Lingulodinium_polyedra.AAC.1